MKIYEKRDEIYFSLIEEKTKMSTLHTHGADTHTLTSNTHNVSQRHEQEELTEKTQHKQKQKQDTKQEHRKKNQTKTVLEVRGERDRQVTVTGVVE